MVNMTKKKSSELTLWYLSFIRNMPGVVGKKMRSRYYRKRLSRCSDNIYISQGCYIQDAQNIILGNNVQLGLNNQLHASGKNNENIEIGDNVAFNSNVMLNGGRIKIGNNVIIGPNVVLRSSNHTFNDCEKPIRNQGHESGYITIEDDVWIGANAVVLPSLTIGKGSVIGAGAVVTKNVEPFSIVGGVPAKLISRRNK